ncbi:hypothetical protein [Actinokineospora inagensis]|uniref:hypothetical protein n=1 Tax=Actinokineospora inagensis TaxID=103730 RepID=UPI0003F4D974|nr:hypothetical protein [Actinokineospora inagensis]
MSEAPAVEPPTDRPAIEDPATAKALSSLRLPLVGLPVAAVVFAGLAGWLIAVGGGWLGITVLVVAAIAFLVTTFLAVVISGRWIGPASKLLREQPWRESPVTVYRPGRGFPRVGLQLPDVALLAPAMPWPAQQILARTGRVWVVGPDERGWAAIRSTGLALPLGQARVTTADLSDRIEVAVEQHDPGRASLAAGDAVLARVIAGPRKRSRTDLVAPILLTVFAIFVDVDLVRRGVRSDQVWLAVGTLVGTLLILGFLGWRGYRAWYWARVDKLLAAGPWKSVSITLPEPNRVRRETVVGQAILIDGRAVAVKLPRAGHALRANISATGLLWVAGTPDAGREMIAGIPGYPFLNRAEFGS